MISAGILYSGYMEYSCLFCHKRRHNVWFIKYMFEAELKKKKPDVCSLVKICEVINHLWTLTLTVKEVSKHSHNLNIVKINLYSWEKFQANVKKKKRKAVAIYHFYDSYLHLILFDGIQNFFFQMKWTRNKSCILYGKLKYLIG